jgi:hypothetical protein
MPISAAMDDTCELPLEVPRPEGRWFGGGGCVVVGADGVRHVYVRGTLVGSFGEKDSAARNLLMVSLAAGEDVHLGQLAEAFDFSVDGLRRIRRLYESEGGMAVARRVNGGHRQKVTPQLREKLEAAFAQGASVNEAWRTVGKRAKLSRATVGTVRLAWGKARTQQVAPPSLEVVPTPPPPPPQQAVPTAAVTPDAAGPARLAVVPAPPESEAAQERLKATRVQDAPVVQHLGTWLLVAMAARMGLHGAALGVAEGRVGADALRLAVDSVVMALGVGERCVEGVRRLSTSTAAALARATDMPSPTWTRRTLSRLAEDGGGTRLHLALARAYLREAQAAASTPGPVFYVDNHLRPYTGKHVVRRGWRMQDKRVRPGTSDYYVHDEDGRPVLRMAAPHHGSLTDWLQPLATLLRVALGPEETILLAFDRGGAFPQQLADLREEGFEFVTYERRPYPALPDAAFTEVVQLDDETLRVCDTRKNLGTGRGRVRRLAVRMEDGRQLNLLANSARSAAQLLSIMRGRWRQENAFKHGVERWGINHLDGRQVQPWAPDTVIPNPARRRLDRALRIARTQEGDARAALARMATDNPRRAALQRTLNDAVAQQSQLEALRPSTPPRAVLRDTELAGRLVHHPVEYKLVLDSLRIACANAESELAALLAPHLPRPAEAKRALANLFTASGSVHVTGHAVHVCLDAAATRPERDAFDALFQAVNQLGLFMPGDQPTRPLRFSSPRK